MTRTIYLGDAAAARLAHLTALEQSGWKLIPPPSPTRNRPR